MCKVRLIKGVLQYSGNFCIFIKHVFLIGACEALFSICILDWHMYLSEA